MAIDPQPPLPAIIQGGMGVGVSGWRLASAVSRAGHLGVVSGTALDKLYACRLQDGDPGGHVRRILAGFPLPAMRDRVLAAWYQPDGPSRPGTYRPVPLLTHEPKAANIELLLVANYAEVALAKEGHGGPVGINLLEKIQLPNLASLYGAMLAGVDVVLMGAGIPREIPQALAQFAAHQPAELVLSVEGALSGESTHIRFVPPTAEAGAGVEGGGTLPPLRRPRFLAVIASDTLAMSLVRSCPGGIDGFVVEGPTAGGHNAPPRGGAGTLSERGEPIYGPRDVVNLDRLRTLGLPFWLGGGYGRPGGLAQAQALGARGIQVGTAFAFCDESGIDPQLKARVLAAVRAGRAPVFTDPTASPTGFPFKVVQLAGTIGDALVYGRRKRVCNLGALRHAYRTATGAIGWRCPAEPLEQLVAKGGDPATSPGRVCLCNGLLATTGHGYAIPGGGREPALLTAGDDLAHLHRFLPPQGGYAAADVLAMLAGSEQAFPQSEAASPQGEACCVLATT